MLSALALRSKAYWGYDADFMGACRDELTITPAEIAAGAACVLDQGRVLGFYRLELQDRIAEVAMFFVDPAAIGQGVGRALWEHLVEQARSLGALRITVASDPHAARFYRRMGARVIGRVPSDSIPDRRLPLLELRLGAAK